MLLIANEHVPMDSFLIIIHYNVIWGRRVIGISGSLIWSKTLKELIFNPCGEFRWSPDGPISQIHSLTSSLVPLGSFKVCSDAKESGVRKATGSYRSYASLVKRQPKIYTGKPGGRRHIGRRRKRWVEGIEEDMREMDVRGWRRKSYLASVWYNPPRM